MTNNQNPRSVTATFQPEYWVNDQTVPTTIDGKTSVQWDATKLFWEIANESNYGACDPEQLDVNGYTTDNEDRFITDIAAPPSIKTWDGPFTITLRWAEPHEDTPDYNSFKSLLDLSRVKYEGIRKAQAESNTALLQAIARYGKDAHPEAKYVSLTLISPTNKYELSETTVLDANGSELIDRDSTDPGRTLVINLRLGLADHLWTGTGHILKTGKDLNHIWVDITEALH